MTFFVDLAQMVGFGLVTLLPLANPLTTVVLFLSLSGNMTQTYRRQQAKWASIYVFIIMAAAYYLGQLVMHLFGISIPGLRIAGGMIVAFIGFHMLFPQRSAEEAPEVEKKTEEMSNYQSSDIAFVPLAMPSTAGPGTIAMIISSASAAKSGAFEMSQLALAVAPPLVFALISVILWVCLRSADGIVRVVGQSGIQAISRVMGFLLVCMGVQFIINGVLEIVTTYPNG